MVEFTKELFILIKNMETIAMNNLLRKQRIMDNFTIIYPMDVENKHGQMDKSTMDNG